MNYCNLFNVSQLSLKNFADTLGCSVGSLPTYFVGLPLCIGPPPKHMWDRVTSKFHKYLASWKSRYLSLGGRLTLIKSALSSLPLYFMSLFVCPGAVLKSIDKVRRDFLWCGKENEKKFHLLDWKEVCKVFSKGGANVKNLKLMNQALLGKWAWRFASEKDALWCSIVRGKYGAAQGGWWPKRSSYYKASFVWRGILKAKDPVCSNSHFLLGDGASIRFWEDPWHGDKPFKPRFPFIYRLAPDRTTFINSCCSSSTDPPIWDIRCRRNLTQAETEEYMELQSCISILKPHGSQSDGIVWPLEKNSSSSVKSLYTILDSQVQIRSDVPSYLWKYQAPPKILCFGWLASRNRILTIDNLIKRGMYLVNSCSCCMRQAESVDHLLIHCPFTSSILNDFCRHFSVSWCAPHSAASLMFDWHGFKLRKPFSIIWRMAILAIWWAVWEERNDRCFNDRSSTARTVGAKAKKWVIEWASNVNALKGILRGNSLSGILSPDLCHLTALALFDVGSNHLAGTIPDNIGNCTNLKILDLSDNQITGVIPSTIILPQLSILMLEGNKLHGKIPEVIGLLQSLDLMDLSQNELVGTIPTLLGNLSNASAIRLHNNKLTGLIPPELGNMSALRYLELNNNQLVGGIPEELGKLGKLIQLNLANNNLEGPVPRTISSCTSLNIFSVHGNRLNGSVPSEFQNLKNLTRLNFSCNNFSGQIPNELGYNINLDTLDVSSNDFSGPIPSFVGLQHLLLLNLSRNRLHGQVPFEIWNNGYIQIIDISYNQLSGEMPTELGQLENIDTLILNNNNLSGVIPVELTNCRSLASLNLSYNNFSGEIPLSRNFSRFTRESFIGNPLLCGHWFNPCGTYSHKSKGVSHALVISVIVYPITILILCVVILTAYKANQPQREQSDKTVKVQGPPQPELIVLNNEFSHYIYKEIMRNTENMNEKYIIGTGASGNVFKCESEGLRPIAIKQFKSRNDKSKIDRQAKTELEVLAHINHKNLIKLLGYSFSSTHGLLIFMRYMKNGSLYDALHGPPEKRCHLVWSTRQTIAVGAAQGLAYLHEHCKPRRIHRDIKSANVLLDENFEACIADFGLARCMADDQINIVTEPGGTRGYIAPECNQIVSEKSDVYSFGVLLLELITGKKALIGNGDNLLTWILSEGLTKETIMNVADPLVLLSCTNPSSVWKTYITACRCTHSRPSSRPSMSLVVAHLTSLLLNPDGQPDYDEIRDE